MKNLILIFAVFFTLSATEVTFVRAQTVKRTTYKGNKKITTKAKTRTGWSKRAKGAAIGGGVGAVGGALVGKSVGGALVGGALGAGAGYVVGNETDKNKSRAPKQTVYKRKVVRNR